MKQTRTRGTLSARRRPGVALAAIGALLVGLSLALGGLGGAQASKPAPAQGSDTSLNAEQTTGNIQVHKYLPKDNVNTPWQNVGNSVEGYEFSVHTGGPGGPVVATFSQLGSNSPDLSKDVDLWVTESAMPAGQTFAGFFVPDGDGDSGNDHCNQQPADGSTFVDVVHIIPTGDPGSQWDTKGNGTGLFHICAYNEGTTPTNTPTEVATATSVVEDTPTPVTPTTTPVTPTETPVTPTTGPGTPTNTPETPTTGPGTPTNTPVTPTNTPVTPTNTPVTPTETATTGGGAIVVETPTNTPPPAGVSQVAGAEAPTNTPGATEVTNNVAAATPEAPNTGAGTGSGSDAPWLGLLAIGLGLTATGLGIVAWQGRSKGQ